MWSSRQTIIKEILRAVSVQFVSTNLVKCLMVHGISWSGCPSGIVEMGIHEYTMHVDNNTILPTYGKRTTNRSVVSFVKSAHVKQEILERTATRTFPFALSSSRGQKSPPRAESGGCFPTTLPAVRTDLDIVRLLSRRQIQKNGHANTSTRTGRKNKNNNNVKESVNSPHICIRTYTPPFEDAGSRGHQDYSRTRLCWQR